MSDSIADQDPTDVVAQEFLARRHRGERPTIDEYTARHPALAEAIRAIFPALLLVEDLKPSSDEPSATSPGGNNSALVPGTERVGVFRIVREIGQGGMGIVYEAEHGAPVRRTVALKIIKPGVDFEHLVARFEAERQALALMNHPNIARVFAAGATGDGRPFLAMELVRGVPITDYCDQERLTLRARLELFATVCRATQHAHQKGIIHRDLKPSNILVTLQDGKPVPKVIDFGIAKAIDRRLTELPLSTQYGTVLGTVEYMSPEHALPHAPDIDTPSDVYSLGVLLYELLTGTTPLERRTLQRSTYNEVLRRIRDEEPPKPSTRLSGSAKSLPSIAALRQTEPSRLARLLKGELEWIVMKALEKHRGRRYETANGLARDIERYLADEAVDACPPSARYRAWKFARKHRQPLASAGAFGVLLVVGAVLSTWQAVRATHAEQQAREERNRAVAAEEIARNQGDAEIRSRLRAEGAERQAHQERDNAVAERQRADVEAATARAVNRFLQFDLLAQANPWNQGSPETSPDPEMKVRTLLDRASDRIAGRLSDKPLVEASIRMSIGNAYSGLHLDPKAQEHYERALALRQRTLGTEHPETLEAMHFLGTAHSSQGRLEQAEALLDNAVKGLSRALGENHLSTLYAMNDLARVFRDQGKLERAEELFVKILEGEGRVSGENDVDTLSALKNLAAVFQKQGKPEKAEAILVKVVERSPRVLGEDHPEALFYKEDLAQLYQSQGRRSEAEPLLIAVLEARCRTLGDDNRDTLRSIDHLTRTLLSESRGSSTAGPAGWKVLANVYATAVRRNPNGPVLRQKLGLALLLAGDREGYRRASAATRERFAGSAVVFGRGAVVRTWLLAPDSSDDLSRPLKLAEAAVAANPKSPPLLYTLGLTHYRCGHDAEAIRVLRRSIDEHPQWPSQALTWVGLALAHHRLGHVEEARRWLEKAHDRKGDSARHVPSSEVVGLASPFQDFGELQILRHEADALINGPDFPDDPFQP